MFVVPVWSHIQRLCNSKNVMSILYNPITCWIFLLEMYTAQFIVLASPVRGTTQAVCKVFNERAGCVMKAWGLITSSLWLLRSSSLRIIAPSDATHYDCFNLTLDNRYEGGLLWFCASQNWKSMLQPDGEVKGHWGKGTSRKLLNWIQTSWLLSRCLHVASVSFIKRNKIGTHYGMFFPWVSSGFAGSLFFID